MGSNTFRKTKNNYKIINMTEQNHKKDQGIYIVALALTALAAIYLYKKWEESQQEVTSLKEVIRIIKENKEVKWFKK